MASPILTQPIEVAATIQELTLDEKVLLLGGKDSNCTLPLERLGIPSITLSDGPHGVRGTRFFNGPRGCMLPAASGMGATFDRDLMHAAGRVLGLEAKEKGVHVVLGPTVCLQRSPLLGRGFEAFGEDPILSGTLASGYINGIQEQGVAACIKHFAAHDQSKWALEDAIRVSERTLRELHLLPFQIAVDKSNPWSFMAAYHQINGVHASEDPWLLNDLLRKEWGWDGLVVSDWFGTYSTSEAVNAGLDLEMPGPTRWRNRLLYWAVQCRKVREATVDLRVRNLLNLLNKVRPALQYEKGSREEGDTLEKRKVCRQIAGDSIVLLKNDRSVLPLDASKKQSYGLIGPAVQYPTVCGGGSADLRPHYIVTPLEAIAEVVGFENIQTAVGAYAHMFTPLLERDITVPGTEQVGYFLEWFLEEPAERSDSKPLATETATQGQMFFADSLPPCVSGGFYWLRVTTTYTAPKTTTMQFGLGVLGRGKMFIDGQEAVDLFTSKPEKTTQTPMFNQCSMEVTADVAVKVGSKYQITVILSNGGIKAKAGAANAGGLRIGCCEKIDPVKGLEEAVELAKNVDVPIVIGGLNPDWESEAIDRSDLELPPALNKLIEAVVRANPRTIVINQSGCPVTMPWIDQASTVLHAWYGGQETGNGMADVLFGKINPNGRLSITFPKRLQDTPAFLNFGKGLREVMYGEGVFLGYRYYEKLQNPPMFYFGHGLSYTTFEYSNIEVPKSFRFLEGAMSMDIAIDIRNIGARDGAEVVQVYIQDVECANDRPLKELKAFAKVRVKVGETVNTKITLDKYALSYWSEEHEKWLAEQGSFRVILARSADPRDELISDTFTLEESFFWTGV
ncbi:hypothetical protein GQ53DRAFT_639298 [Thozetella sp. PMI_491]|nr:hypothetical protein GQ53DRAFT_639298 [Thozetella sp. PMI_491]